jgi:hypothetical protein
MPVVMWGGGDLETLKDIGFTHHILGLVDYAKVWADGEVTQAMSSAGVAEMAEALDQHLLAGIGVVASVSPGHWIARSGERSKRFQRIGRNGEPYDRVNPCCGFPELQRFALHVGASIANTFGDFPALQSALIHTEIRDGTNLCFHDHDRSAFQHAAGFGIPDGANSKAGVHYTTLPDFPSDRVILDRDPLLVFYRWFWSEGDGWNPLHCQVHQGLKTSHPNRLWTFFDPAVRVPSLWGSGGDVDVISQWTYSYPDPLKIGQATDELFAMADGARHEQRVMKMTQIIWYRSQTAPDLPQRQDERVTWEQEIPDAKFITIAPDHLREAFWSKISRPIQGIMYHGWGSLVAAPHGSYRFTNPQTRQVLRELIDSVVTPLGPTLLQVPDRPSDVALLESFASQMFAGRGTRGWGNSWEADMHLILQWAQLQPRIVYDQTVLRDGLDDFRVLVLPHCDVLTRPVADRIAEFQRNGGLLVADEHLAPALQPDILVSSYRRTAKADQDKAVLQARASQLRKALDTRYPRYCDSSNRDVVVRCRSDDRSDFVFVVNDRRTFGRYVGHHGRVMEKGLPASSEIFVRREDGHVYDLVRHEQVAAKSSAAGLTFPVDLGPGGGRVFMITDRALAQLQVQVPAEARRGNAASLRITVTDDEQKPMDAVVPLHVSILDSEGREAEFSGYYGAKQGTLELGLFLATNDSSGRWEVHVKELASGITASDSWEVY